MSDTEKEEFKLDIVDALIKKYRPLVTFLSAFIVFVVSSTWWVAHNVATTSDVNEVKVTVDTLNSKFSRLQIITPTQAEKAHGAINKRIDSLISNTHYTGVIQHKDKYGNITYRPYVN